MFEECDKSVRRRQ